MGRERLIPSSFGKLNRNQVPHVAIVTALGLAAVVVAMQLFNSMVDRTTIDDRRQLHRYGRGDRHPRPLAAPRRTDVRVLRRGRHRIQIRTFQEMAGLGLERGDGGHRQVRGDMEELAGGE